MSSLEIAVCFQTISCYLCHVKFAITSDHMEKLRATHANFYCPSGHDQHFAGKTEADKLRDELLAKDETIKRIQESKSFWADRARTEERRRCATRAVVTKLKARIGSGVCPCCKRSFTALREHMATKHPNFKAEVKS